MVNYRRVAALNPFETGLVFALCAACFYELHVYTKSISVDVPIALTFSRWFILIAAACLLGGQPAPEWFERWVEGLLGRYT